MKVISIDAMGGDYGPDVTVPASLMALKDHPDLEILLVGLEDRIKPLLAGAESGVLSRCRVVAAREVVAMDELPAVALRNKKDSSMRVAINLVKQGAAAACVSAGNTGALMATARFVLKTPRGIDRPAIVSRFPTLHEGRETTMLDLGANVDCSPEQLYQFAVMASVLVTSFGQCAAPKVALLNIGSEHIKGNELVKQASQLLENSPHINYVGFVEGNTVFSGDVDVVVCDGFSGNVFLKSCEGVARLLLHVVRQEFRRSWLTRLAGLIAMPVLYRVRHNIHPGRRNGAILLGLNGVVVKSHGGADSISFASAISQACFQIEKDVPQLISSKLGRILHEI